MDYFEEYYSQKRAKDFIKGFYAKRKKETISFLNVPKKEGMYHYKYYNGVFISIKLFDDMDDLIDHMNSLVDFYSKTHLIIKIWV